MAADDATSRDVRPIARARPYIVGAACVLAAVALRLALAPLLQVSQIWLTFWPAVFIAAWWRGARAAVLATLLSVGVVMLWLLPFQFEHALDAGHVLGAVVFAVSGIAFASLFEYAQRARRAEAIARAEAMAASRAKDEFLAVLGHELRNPLAPIATAATLMRMRGATSRELEVIERQVAHMTRLVDDLLDVSRVVRGTLDLQRESVELAAVVEKAVEVVAPVRERTAHILTVEVPADLPVDVDPSRLVQVLTNLLTNAMKFSPPTEPIRVVAQREGERVVLRVIDRGIGMDHEMLTRAFEAFVQGPQAPDRAVGGLGLGLAISRRLVELHHGTLTAASEGPGRGTEMRLELPVSHAPAKARAPATAPAAPPPRVGGMRILVVDDNQDSAQLLGDLLAARGHAVRVAYDGKGALEVASSFSPTLALLDIGLPGMDGYELARALRACGIHAPLVAVTGYGQESDRERALRGGFDEHLVKPVSLAKVQKIIDKVSGPAAA